MIYFDACSIAKFYLAEPDSPSVTAFARGNANVGCLLIGKAEVVAVFHRKLRESVVDVSGFHLLCDQFASDCASGLGRGVRWMTSCSAGPRHDFADFQPRFFSALPMGCTSLARLRKDARRSTPATAT